MQDSRIDVNIDIGYRRPLYGWIHGQDVIDAAFGPGLQRSIARGFIQPNQLEPIAVLVFVGLWLPVDMVE